jgi:hypothetical protein
VPLSLIFLSVPDSAPTFAASWALAAVAKMRMDAAAKTIVGQPRTPAARAIAFLACVARMTGITQAWA